MLACMMMALAGFLTFGDKTQGNILNNFPRDNVMVNTARLCVNHHLKIMCLMIDEAQSLRVQHVDHASSWSAIS